MPPLLSSATEQLQTTPHDNPVLSGFPAVINDQTHTLILGSFPSEASLQAQQYYAFRHNQFWGLLSATLNTDLVSLSYEEKLHCLLSHGIGLWDVFERCQRKGSLDSAIRAGQINDFVGLKKQFPTLRRVCFNGKTAAKIQHYFQSQGYQTLVLPSSSPANAMLRMEQKCALWRQLVQDDRTALSDTV